MVIMAKMANINCLNCHISTIETIFVFLKGGTWTCARVLLPAIDMATAAAFRKCPYDACSVASLSCVGQPGRSTPCQSGL